MGRTPLNGVWPCRPMVHGELSACQCWGLFPSTENARPMLAKQVLWGRVRNDLKLAPIIRNDVKLLGESHRRLLHCSRHPPPPYMNTPDSSIRKNKTCPPAIALSLAPHPSL